MISTRRNFLRQTLGGGAAAAMGTLLSDHLQTKLLLEQITEAGRRNGAVENEDFWHLVKQAYTVSPSLLNLNNGGVCPQPAVVQQAVERYNRLSNEAPSYYMWRILDQGREPLRRKLASIAGCSAEEIAINRNSSEALETIIFGLELKKGDEVVLARQDYPNMINAWKQRERRDGVVLKWLDFDFPIDDADRIVQKFTSAFTAATRVVHITQVINWNGQVLPVARIARAAREARIDSVVDGAHAFAHLDFKIPDLTCDYYGTSLHKWLCAPFGSGMLYVRKEKIAALYPLLAAPDPAEDNIRKFEHLGTRSFAIEQAIGQACDFHGMIGSARKFERLHFLKNYWAEAALNEDRVSIGTSLDPRFGGAIGLLQIDGMEPTQVSRALFRDYKIHTTAINWENIYGVRITPNVYTVKSDLDRLGEAIRAICTT